MARQVTAFRQGSRQSEEGFSHREHRSNARRSPRGANRRMSPIKKRHGKAQQLAMQKSKAIPWQRRRFVEWKRAHPDEPNRKNPFVIPRAEFKNLAFKDAFADAGIYIDGEQIRSKG